jgi:hypothetical protein
MSARTIIEASLDGYTVRAQKQPDVEKFIRSLDSYTGADVLYRGHHDEAPPNNCYMTDYVGHAATYAGDEGRVDAYVYDPRDVLQFNDARFEEMRRFYLRLPDAELATAYRSALTGNRHAGEFSQSLPLVRKTLRSDVPYSQVSGDPRRNDALVPLMQKYARDVHGKNIVSFHGSDYADYGGQAEFVVGDVSKLTDLRRLHASVHRDVVTS